MITVKVQKHNVYDHWVDVI